MIHVADIDRLVIQDDELAARLWPRLGPRVREAYTRDRDAWIALRRGVDAGKTPSPSVLAAQRKTFAGWARAFQTAARPRAAGRVPKKPVVAAARAVESAAPVVAERGAVAPAAAMTAPSSSRAGAGAAVAGGLVLAGLIAVAAKRRRP